MKNVNHYARCDQNSCISNLSRKSQTIRRFAQMKAPRTVFTPIICNGETLTWITTSQGSKCRKGSRGTVGGGKTMCFSVVIAPSWLLGDMVLWLLMRHRRGRGGGESRGDAVIPKRDSARNLARDPQSAAKQPATLTAVCEGKWIQGVLGSPTAVWPQLATIEHFRFNNELHEATKRCLLHYAR